MKCMWWWWYKFSVFHLFVSVCTYSCHSCWLSFFAFLVSLCGGSSSWYSSFIVFSSCVAQIRMGCRSFAYHLLPNIARPFVSFTFSRFYVSPFTMFSFQLCSSGYLSAGFMKWYRLFQLLLLCLVLL